MRDIYSIGRWFMIQFRPYRQVKFRFGARIYHWRQGVGWRKH